MSNIPPVKQSVEQWLNDTDYRSLRERGYTPSEFAINYVNFIKMVNNDAGGEANKTPVVHLKMLDELAGDRTRLANLCSRGLAKALSLDTPVLTPLGYMPMEHIHVGDEVFDRDGKITLVTHESEVFHKPTYRINLTDGTSFVTSEDHINIVQWRSSKRGPCNPDGSKSKTIPYWKEAELTTKELVEKGFFYTKSVSDRCPTGKELKYFIPLVSDVVQFPARPVKIDPYFLGVILGDGNIAQASGIVTMTTHVDDLDELISKIPHEIGGIYTDKRNPDTKSFRVLGLDTVVLSTLGAKTSYNKTIPAEYLYNSEAVRVAVLRGLMDTDGTITPDGYAYFCSVSQGLAEGVRQLVKSLGGSAKIIRRENQHAGYWQIAVNLPNICPFSMARKVARWQSGKTINSGKRVGISSIEPVDIAPSKCIAVASDTHSYLIEGCTVTHNTTLFGEYLTLYIALYGEIDGFGDVSGMIYISDSMENGVKSLRKNIEHRYNNSEFLRKYIPEVKFTDAYLEFTNADGHKLGVRLFGSKTGLRGTKIFGKRPVLAVLDDLVSDDDAKSKSTMQAIKDTVYKGVDYALDPTRRKIVFSGTPFNKNDILYEAVESGGWYVNVFPICERFPCTREEFVGAWEDRFSYEFVKGQYDLAVATGQVAAFNQELMLRITSDEERLILEDDIQWYKRKSLLANKGNFNFYITTDFATSEKDSGDYSVISVWALNNNGDWFWVDGLCKRQLMNANIDALFKFALEYQPQSVGVEVTGQQGGFIQWIQGEMMTRNIWFNLASDNNSNRPGIRPNTNKMVRFNTVLPWFKAGKMFFPEEMKDQPVMMEAMDELRMATLEGFKSKHDDFVDTVSMLSLLKVWKPSQVVEATTQENGIWAIQESPEAGGIDSYLV